MNLAEPPTACWFAWPTGEMSIALEWPLGLTVVEDALLARCESIVAHLCEDSSARDCREWFLHAAARRASVRSARVGSGPITDVAGVHFHFSLADTVGDFLQEYLRVGELPGTQRPVDSASLAPLPEAEFVCVARCGAWKDARIHREFDARFGAGNWRTGYTWGGMTLDVRSGIQIYEDGYYHALRNDPELLEWLLTYQDVYDTSPTNTDSYCDYSLQEVEGASQHWQDVAIRRVLRRLGLWFRGQRLLEIRGHSSEGYRLNPGQLPFHRADLLVQPRQYGWWQSGSIEEFSIGNYAVQVPLGIALDYLRGRGPDPETCELLLMAQHRSLFPEMVRLAATGGPRTHLFIVRTLQLMPEPDQLEFLQTPAVPEATRELWALSRPVSPQTAEVIDRLLADEPESRADGLSRVLQLEPRLRRRLVEAVCEDPARRLRNQAKGMLANV